MADEYNNHKIRPPHGDVAEDSRDTDLSQDNSAQTVKIQVIHVGIQVDLPIDPENTTTKVYNRSSNDQSKSRNEQAYSSTLRNDPSSENSENVSKFFFRETPVRGSNTDTCDPCSQNLASCSNTQLIRESSAHPENTLDTRLCAPSPQEYVNASDTQLCNANSQNLVNCSDSEICDQASHNLVNCSDIQMTSASTVNIVNSTGAQIGDGNTINNNTVHNHYNNTYNNTIHIFCNNILCPPLQHEELLRWAEQQVQEASRHPQGLPSNDVTQQLMKMIKTVTSKRTTQDESAYVSVNFQAMKQASVPSTDVGNNGTDMEVTNNNNESQLPMNTEAGYNQAKDPPAKTIWYMLGQFFLSKVSQSVEERQSSSDAPLQDSVIILDSHGWRLEPGDAIWMEGPGYWACAVYVGNQQVLWYDRRMTDDRVKKGELNLKEPYGKLAVNSVGRCQLFSSRERVIRAMSQEGMRFTDGGGIHRGIYSDDFPTWVYTGLTYRQDGLERRFTSLSKIQK